MKFLKCINLNKYLSIIGSILFLLPVFFLENVVLCGILSILGLSVLILSGRMSKKISDYFVCGISIFIGYLIRFSTSFGTDNILYSLILGIFFLPIILSIIGSIILSNIVNKTKVYYLSIFITPIIYTLFTIINSKLNLGFISNTTSYVMLIVPYLSSLSLLGEYGMTFWVMLVISLIIELIINKHKIVKVVTALSAFLLFFIPLLSGIIKINNYPNPNYSIKVTLATSQQMTFTGESGTYYTKEQQLEMFENAIIQAKNDNADLLVLNEEYFTVKYENKDYLYDQISYYASLYNIPVLAGIQLDCGDYDYWVNEALYFNSNGEVEYTYIKNNLVPLVESGDYIDGEELSANFTTNIGGHDINISYVICFDINDYEYMNKISDDTELLIVPCWDWDNANIEQLRTSVFSAFTNTTLLKHSFDGFSFVSTPLGIKDIVIDLRQQFEKVVTISVPIWEK